MNYNPYSNPNYGIANKRQSNSPSSSSSNNLNKTPSQQVSSSVSTPTPLPNSNETNRRTVLPKLDANQVKNLSQEIEEELSSPKRSTNQTRARSQSRLVNLEKDSDDEESSSKNQDQVRTILTVEVTVIKPTTNGWRVVSNSSLLSLYSSERKQALTSEVEIPTEMALWKELPKKKGFDLYLFLKLNENVQFQILKSVNDESNGNNQIIGSSYLVIKYVDKRSEKIQFIGLVLSTVADLQSIYNLLQRCIVSVPVSSTPQTPSKSISPSEELDNTENNLNEKDDLKMKTYKNVIIDHIQNQILYHTKQMCYHELQKEELLKQLQKLENE